MMPFKPGELEEILSLACNRIAKNIKNKESSNSEDDFLTLAKAACFLHVTKATLHNWRKEGRITAVRMGGRVFICKRELLELTKPNHPKKNDDKP